MPFYGIPPRREAPASVMGQTHKYRPTNNKYIKSNGRELYNSECGGGELDTGQLALDKLG